MFVYFKFDKMPLIKKKMRADTSRAANLPRVDDKRRASVGGPAGGMLRGLVDGERYTYIKTYFLPPRSSSARRA